jgi:hypothetical protein
MPRAETTGTSSLMLIIQNRFRSKVIDANSVQVSVIGERPDDELECFLCGTYGGVFILQVGEDRMIDVCPKCAKALRVR